MSRSQHVAPDQALVRNLQFAAFRSLGPRLRIRLQPRLSRSAGAVGSAVRRFRQRRADHHRSVHRRRAKTSGICSPESCCCCRTATKAKARNIPARASSDFCSSPRATTFKFASRPPPRNIFICCAARRCARGASRWSSSRRRACCAIRLRLPPLADLSAARFQPVIPDSGDGTATRVLLCTGKIGHELEAERKRRKDDSHRHRFCRAALSVPRSRAGRRNGPPRKRPRIRLGAGRTRPTWARSHSCCRASNASRAAARCSP